MRIALILLLALCAATYRNMPEPSPEMAALKLAGEALPNELLLAREAVTVSAAP